jgi:hypothetical protein
MRGGERGGEREVRRKRDLESELLPKRAAR